MIAPLLDPGEAVWKQGREGLMELAFWWLEQKPVSDGDCAEDQTKPYVGSLWAALG